MKSILSFLDPHIDETLLWKYQLYSVCYGSLFGPVRRKYFALLEKKIAFFEQK